MTTYLLRNNWGEEDFILAYSLKDYRSGGVEECEVADHLWLPVTAARKQSSNGKLDQAIKTEDAPLVSHFL